MMATLNAIDGVYCLRTHGGSFQQKGTPDILGSARGRFFAIEAKRSAKERATPAQLYTMKKFEEAGAATFISHDPKVQEVVEWILTL